MAWVALEFRHPPGKDILAPFMPESRSPKYHPQGHLINKRFQRRTLFILVRKMQMHPRPELAVPISTIVTLHPVAQRFAAERIVVQSNLSRKNRIRMRRPRKSNPTFAA